MVLGVRWTAPLLLLLLSLLEGGSSHNSSTPRGCGLDLPPRYAGLCDLEAVWGIVLEAVAGAGALTALLLALILLGRLPFITEQDKRSPVGLLLLLLLGVLGLFGLSFTFIIQPDKEVCIARRALWGVLFALCFSCLLAQGWRLRRLVRHGKGPGGWQLSCVALSLTLVQVIIATEWLVLTVVREEKQACDYQPVDFTLACSYVVVLLATSLALSLFSLCGKFRKWKRSGVCLILASSFSVLLWVAWASFYLYGNSALGRSPVWDDPGLAVALVANGWVLLLFHAIPEVHCSVLPAPPPSAPDYFDTSQLPPRLRETCFDDEVPLPHRPFVENKAFSFDEHSAASCFQNVLHCSVLLCTVISLRAGGHRNGSLGLRPSAPFRSNVYQPTEMAVLLNGGTEKQQLNAASWVLLQGCPLGPSPRLPFLQGSPLGPSPRLAPWSFSTIGPWVIIQTLLRFGVIVVKDNRETSFPIIVFLFKPIPDVRLEAEVLFAVYPFCPAKLHREAPVVSRQSCAERARSVLHDRGPYLERLCPIAVHIEVQNKAEKSHCQDRTQPGLQYSWHTIPSCSQTELPKYSYYSPSRWPGSAEQQMDLTAAETVRSEARDWETANTRLKGASPLKNPKEAYGNVTGPTQQLDNKINDSKQKQKPWPVSDSPAQKLVFSRVNGKRSNTPVPQTDSQGEGYTAAHQDNVNFVYEAWQEVEQRLGDSRGAENGHGPVQYTEKAPSPSLKSESSMGLMHQ
ncbi:GPC5B protein, partial [Polyodon spathula]|nr:GPC5B protein [Polyodon spathula]